ncbi:hypothetical protein C8R47DRAFT_1148926 [Mycena vitilis]|nr:hypothetical protein C8R47DRAFT_1148926 [Mycena vitilis]
MMRLVLVTCSLSAAWSWFHGEFLHDVHSGCAMLCRPSFSEVKWCSPSPLRRASRIQTASVGAALSQSLKFLLYKKISRMRKRA